MMIRYLLGQLSAGERAELEERYFADDELFNELASLENEIIDFYVQGKLSEDQRQQFESYFLANPERREKVRFAKSLLNYVNPSALSSDLQEARPNLEAPQTSVLPMPASLSFMKTHGLRLAAVFLVLAAVVLWVFMTNHPRRDLMQQQAHVPPTHVESKSPQPQPSPLLTHPQANHLKDVPSQLPPSATASLVLSDGLTRSSGEQPSLLITPDISQVSLQLNLERDLSFTTYTVRLATAEGKPIWHARGLKSYSHQDGKAITINLPSKLFHNGDYIVRLSGTSNRNQSEEEIEAYSLRVLNRTQR